MPEHGEKRQLERTRDYRYDLRQRLNRAVRWLREAEDIARIEMPGWRTADRIRDIYEQVSEDVLNGRSSVPPLLQRLRDSEAEAERLHEALRHLHEFGVRLMGSEVMEERSIGCCVAEGSRIAAGKRTPSQPDMPNISPEQGGSENG